MEEVAKHIEEHITIECFSFESVQEQIAGLADCRDISISSRTYRDEDDKSAPIWTIKAKRTQRDSS